MKGPQSIDFVLRGRVDGVEITPATIGLSRFNEFNGQVEEFVGVTKHGRRATEGGDGGTQ